MSAYLSSLAVSVVSTYTIQDETSLKNKKIKGVPCLDLLSKLDERVNDKAYIDSLSKQELQLFDQLKTI